MASTTRAVCILVTVIGVTALVLRPTVVVAQDGPKITITVYNRSKMRASTLAAGQIVARDILLRAALESSWVSCAVGSTPETNPECRLPPSATRLVLTIVPHWAGALRDSDTLGLALEVEHGFGSQCYVFQERLDELAAATHISPARLLGDTIAHEIGHLLKGSKSHSPSGLMMAHWQANELRAAAMGSLNFTADDAALMRIRLAQVESRK